MENKESSSGGPGSSEALREDLQTVRMEGNRMRLFGVLSSP